MLVLVVLSTLKSNHMFSPTAPVVLRMENDSASRPLELPTLGMLVAVGGPEGVWVGSGGASRIGRSLMLPP